jgi:hypothetical protein
MHPSTSVRFVRTYAGTFAEGQRISHVGHG